jgi:hypothetical protein
MTFQAMTEVLLPAWQCGVQCLASKGQTLLSTCMKIEKMNTARTRALY